MDQFSFEKLQKFAQDYPAVALFVLAFVMAVPVIVAMRRVRSQQLPPDIEHEPLVAPPRPDPIPQPIARMTEKVTITGGGAFCAVMLSLTVLFQGARFLAASTLADLINTGLGLLIGVLLWGGGLALGRRRSYVIYNVPAPPERAEPKL